MIETGYAMLNTGSCSGDRVQANVEHLILMRLFFCDSPAQVNIHQMNPMRFELFPQRREYAFDQPVTFRMHVAERG